MEAWVRFLGQDMSVLGPLVKDGDDLGQVYSQWCPRSVLFDSEFADLQVLISWQLADALLMPYKCYSAYSLVCVHDVHVTLALGGSHLESILHWSPAHLYVFRMAINKLF
jgi:hypothetical protein